MEGGGDGMEEFDQGVEEEVTMHHNGECPGRQPEADPQPCRPRKGPAPVPFRFSFLFVLDSPPRSHRRK